MAQAKKEELLDSVAVRELKLTYHNMGMWRFPKIRRGIQPQGVQIPLKTPSTPQPGHPPPPPPPPPCPGGWPSPARPSCMKFQPRPRFEALAVRGGRIFRSKLGFLLAPSPPEGPWRPLEPLGGPCKALEPPATAWNRVETPICMDEAE